MFLGRAHWRHGAAGPAGRARAGDGAAADLQDRVPGRRDPPLPRPGHRHHHQGRRVRPDRRGPRPARARCTCSTRSSSAASRPRSAGRRSTAARTRRPRSAGRTRSRSRSPSEGVEDGTLLVGEGQRLPARLLPRRRPGRLRHAGRRRLGVRRRPARPGADPGRRRGAAVGADPGRAALRGAQDHRHGPDGDVAGDLSFMADPALAASVLPAPGEGFDIAAFLRSGGTVYMIAEAIGEDAPVAPLFAAMADRDPLHRRADRAGVGVGAAGPAAADGPGRGHPDLPGPAPVLAVGLRRQGHPGRRRRARGGAAGRPVGRPRPPGRLGHPLGQGVPARHHRHHHPAGRQRAVRAGVVEDSAARTTPAATTSPPRT